MSWGGGGVICGGGGVICGGGDWLIDGCWQAGRRRTPRWDRRPRGSRPPGQVSPTPRPPPPVTEPLIRAGRRGQTRKPELRDTHTERESGGSFIYCSPRRSLCGEYVTPRAGNDQTEPWSSLVESAMNRSLSLAPVGFFFALHRTFELVIVLNKPQIHFIPEFSFKMGRLLHGHIVLSNCLIESHFLNPLWRPNPLRSHWRQKISQCLWAQWCSGLDAC